MRILSSLLVLTVLSTGSLYAKKPEHAGNGNKEKKEKKHKKQKKNKKQSQQNRHFSSEDVNTVQTYYRDLPPGLQKKMRKGGRLPPGWSKKVYVGQPVPQEYMKIAKPAPDDLRIKLKLDSNTKLLEISNRLLKVELGTNRLLGEIKFK